MSDPHGRLRRHDLLAFGGARCSIVAVDVSDEELSMAVAEVYAFEARLTRFDPRSELSQLNARAGRRVAVSPLLGALLDASLRAHEISGGLVNAACLPALAAAGYDRTIEQVRRRPAAPPRCHAEPLPPLPEVLDLGDGWARLAPGRAVDLGGVGKGWLADRLAERLGCALVNLGGDLRAIGAAGTEWRVRLCGGRVVRLAGAGVATSGIAGRRWEGGHHLIDPRTGRPAATDLAAVSVVAADALTAETLAKSAAVLGSAAAGPWLAAHGASDHALLVDSPPAPEFETITA